MEMNGEVYPGLHRQQTCSELRRFNSSIRHIAPTAKHDGLPNWFPVSFSKFWFWFLLLLSPKNTEIKSENDSLVLKNVKSTVNKT